MDDKEYAQIRYVFQTLVRAIALQPGVDPRKLAADLKAQWSPRSSLATQLCAAMADAAAHGRVKDSADLFQPGDPY